MNPTSALTGLLAQMSESAPDQWADTFLGLDPEQRFALLIVALGCATGLIITLVCVISSAISQAHQRRLETEFKREMLDRGMSADEVAKVINASAPEEPASYLGWLFGPMFCRK